MQATAYRLPRLMAGGGSIDVGLTMGDWDWTLLLYMYLPLGLL